MPGASAQMPPQPASTTTYCLPLIEKVTGAAVMPVCTLRDQSFAPLAAS